MSSGTGSKLPIIAGKSQDTATIEAKNENVKLPVASVQEALAARDVTLAIKLVENGASVHEVGLGGRTLLHITAVNGYKAVAEKLLESKAKVNAVDDQSRTPLQLACGHGHSSMVELLLVHGADINIQDNDGWTALHHAISKQYNEIVKLLLQKGADTKLKTSAGLTALELAIATNKYTAYLVIAGSSENDASRLCQACRGITYQTLMLPERKVGPEGESGVKGYVHSENFGQLVKSADTCLLCLYFVASIEKGAEQGDGPVFVFFIGNQDIVRNPLRQGAVMVAHPQKRRSGLFEVNTDYDAVAVHGRIIQKPYPGNPVCEENIIAIKKWMAVCDFTHHGCRPLARNVMPTRLLDLAPENHPYSCVLVDTNSIESCEYAALSYCWGIKPAQMTERATISSFQYPNGIDLEKGPKTYRDAALTTRLLGLRYLWIDSLCIIQDDVADWRHEAQNMGDIYLNAVVTLAATGSISTTDGFLIDRQPELIPISYDGPGVDEGYGYFNISPITTGRLEVSRLNLDIEKTTWNRRGWTLQERFMSRKVIHFTAGVIVLECKGGVWIECHEHKSSDWWKIADARRQDRQDKDVLHDDMRSEINDATLRGWTKLLIEYSKRSLTFPDDKIWAVEGLARNFQRRAALEYIAGFWTGPLNSEQVAATISPEDPKANEEPDPFLGDITSSNLCVQLPWIACAPPQQPPQRNRAPSWSWLVTDGELCWLSLGTNLFPTTRLRIVEQPPGSLQGHPELHLRGKLRRIRRAETPDVGFTFKQSYKYELNPKLRGIFSNFGYPIHGWYTVTNPDDAVQDQWIGVAAFDRVGPEDDVFWALQIATVKFHKTSIVLLLQEEKTEKKEERVGGSMPRKYFRRVGAGEISVKTFFDETESIEMSIT